MTSQVQFTSNTETLLADDETLEKLDSYITKIVEELKRSKADYSIASVWKTTPIDPDTDLGKENMADIVVLLHTDISERDIAEQFYNDLEDLAVSTIINKAVRITIDENHLNVVPTKFGAQGTISIDGVDYPLFQEILGRNEFFQKASVLLQQWQVQQGLDAEAEILLAVEIEMILSHIIKEFEPESLEELIKTFFSFTAKERFSSQLNILDQHNNILLNHNFMIPDKQPLLERVLSINQKLDENTDLNAIFQSR